MKRHSTMLHAQQAEATKLDATTRLSAEAPAKARRRVGMAGEWRDTTLGQVTDFLSGGTPSKEVAKYWSGLTPWVSAKDMKQFRLEDTEDHVTEDGLANGTKLVPAGTVLLLARGMTLLNDLPICVVNRPMTFNQDVKALRPKPGVRNEFLPYLLLGNKDRLLNLVDLAGHGTGRLNSDELKALDVVLPPELEQRAIAHILGTLDDKIELNGRMNETLEAMARALFKSWFVDFLPVRANMKARNRKARTQTGDPIRAKAKGCDPGLPKHIADLFPDSFEDSEQGKIPKGWEARSLYETAEFINGAAFKSKDFCDPSRGLPIVKIAELKNGISAQTKFSERVLGPKQLIDKGELLYSWSGSPDTSLDAFLWTKGRGLLNQHIFKVVTPSIAKKRFVYYLLKFLRPTLVEIARNKQTTGLGHVTIADMKRLYVCSPPIKVLGAFDSQVAPLFDRAFKNTTQNQIATALRDNLLPKLISGELRMKDGERVCERAGA